MYRVTTPTHTYTLPVDTSTLDEIQVTYQQDDVKLVKHYQDNTIPDGMSLNEKTVTITLSQEETMMFSKGKASSQIRVRQGNSVKASQKFSITIYDVINEDILS